MSPLCVCVSAVFSMCGEKLRIPLTSLGPDSCRRRHIERSSSMYFGLFFRKDGSLQTVCLGPWIQRVFVGSHSFTAALCQPSIQPIESHGNKTSFTRCPFLHILPLHFLLLLLLLSLSHWPSLLWKPTKTGRVGRLIGLQGDLVGLCV